VNNFVGYEPTRKEKVIAGILWSAVLILLMIYIAKQNPDPQFVCDLKCRILHFVFIIPCLIIGMIVSFLAYRTSGGEDYES
jgi:hypothetical protein